MNLKSPELSHLPNLDEWWQDASYRAQQKIVNGGSNFELAKVRYYKNHHEGNLVNELFYITGVCGKEHDLDYMGRSHTVPHLIAVKRCGEQSSLDHRWIHADVESIELEDVFSYIPLVPGNTQNVLKYEQRVYV
ncbi:MAG: hypothetical protein AABX16_00510 [Nanoarchaeota archaeon]